VVSRAIGRSERILGRPDPPAPPIELRAGPVRYLLDGIDIRHVREGAVELVERVYMAVRDAPWNTIPGVVSGLAITSDGDASQVTFHVQHRHEDIDLEWDGLIDGRPDGTVRYSIDVLLHGSFRYSKVGCNVHHALAGSVGRPFRARTADGELRGILPVAIDPQRVVDGTLSGMFAPYDELAIEVAPGVEAVTSIEGDLLELQDQRNWIDANLKSYATPLSLGFPFTSTDGQRIRQAITIRRAGDVPPPRSAADPVLRLGGVVGPMPRLGLGMRSDGAPLSPAEAARVAAVRPDHLRVDLVLRDDAWLADLDRATADALAVGAALELAIAASADSGPSLDRLVARLRERPVPVDRVLVRGLADGFSAVVGTTPPEVARLVAGRLRAALPGVVVAGGTDQSFADVNRDPPTDPAIEAICFAMSPTIHAADDISVMETVAGAGEVVRSARALVEGAPEGRPVIVSPVTLATRFGPYPAGPAADGDLPSAVDVRQPSLLAAAWTVAALGAMAVAGAASVTWYETAGWRGIIQGDRPPPMPERFPANAGEVFPVWHVLMDLAPWRDARVRSLASSAPMVAAGIAIETPDGPALVVANLTPDAQRLRLEGLPGAVVRVRTLDDAAADWALDDPDAFRSLPGTPLPVRDGVVWLGLGPYAVARVVTGASTG
jgi:hypothetical protein